MHQMIDHITIAEKMRASGKNKLEIINALESQLSSDRAALDAARKELTLWQDPDYVKAQARERLHFVMPGERQYIVTGTPNGEGEVTTNKVADQLEDGAPWYTRMIASITQVTSEK